MQPREESIGMTRFIVQNYSQKDSIKVISWQFLYVEFYVDSLDSISYPIINLLVY